MQGEAVDGWVPSIRDKGPGVPGESAVLREGPLQAEARARLQRRVRFDAVFPRQRLGSDAVHLADLPKGLALTNGVPSMRRVALLRLHVQLVARLEDMVLRDLVVRANLPRHHVQGARQGFLGVAHLDKHVLHPVNRGPDAVAVVQIDGSPAIVRLADDRMLLLVPLDLLRIVGGHGRRQFPAGHVEQVQVVLFNEGDEAVGVLGVGGVAAGLQSLRPTFVIRQFEVKQPRVPIPQQELAVVVVAVFGVVVHPEAFALGVVVMVGALSGPGRVALDAKVVVGFLGQLTHAVPTLQDALGQGDARGDAVTLHLLNGFVLPLLDVGLVGGDGLGAFVASFGIAHGLDPTHDPYQRQGQCAAQGVPNQRGMRDGCLVHGGCFLNVQATRALPLCGVDHQELPSQPCE